MSSRPSPNLIPTSIPTRNDLAQTLADIGLGCLAADLDDFLARVIKARLSPRQILEEIARMEAEARRQRSLELRLERARLGRFKPMADFDWRWPKKIERDLIERAFTLDFLKEGRNLILLGTNGLGKTMMAKNLAFTAVQAGYSALFTTAAELIENLQGDLSRQTLRRKITRYASFSLLCIDEVGYLAYDTHAADLLYKVVDRRYDKNAPIVLTTNLAFRDWNTVFPNATSIATLLDKLTHHADVTLIEGDSYRKHESKQEADRRRKQRT